MTFDDIATFVCNKVGKTDLNSVAICRGFVTARHRVIYESFPWHASQQLLVPAVDPNQDAIDSIAIPSAAHIISVSVNGVMLDPVSSSYVLESSQIDLDTPSTTPKYYDVFYSPTDQTPSIQFYPPLDQSSGTVTYTVTTLIKRVLYDTQTHVAVPHTENALIAFVLGDMWEYLHSVGKAQLKFQEAEQLLKEAQQSDTPPSPRVRMSVPLTATGNSLGELTDSVCNIIGKFDPDTKVSVKERIRRNHQSIVNSGLFPEQNILMTLTVSSAGEVLIPPLMERVIAVRTNLFTPDVITGFAGNPYELRYQDIPTWFGVQPTVFEQAGAELKFSYKPPVAVLTMPVVAEKIVFTLTRAYPGRERIGVFVKGLAGTEESYESVDVWATPIGDETSYPNTTVNVYDTPLTIAKPITQGTLIASGQSSNQKFVTLFPLERERKHMRLWLLPNSTNQIGGPTPSAVDTNSILTSVLVYGKQRLSNLVDDNDTCQIRNVENVLINGAAADMLFAMGKSDMAQMLKSKADASMQQVLDLETKQTAYEPRILPYVEAPPLDANTFC